MLGWVWLAFLCAAARTGGATVPMRFERLGLDEGLSELAVNAIKQDPSGFIWIGTEDGLNRYDGYRFLHFTHDPRDATSVPDNYITDMCFDGAGRQWIATDGGGVARRDSGSSVFVPLEAGARGPAGRDDLKHVRVAAADHEGRIWIGTRRHGVTVVDASGVSHHYGKGPAAAQGMLDDSVLAFANSAGGAMWIASDGGGGGLSQYEPETDSFRNYELDPSEAAGPQSGRVTAIAEDRLGRIWVGTDGEGIAIVTPGTATVLRLRHQPGEPRSISSDAIFALYIDPAGTAWIGTRGAGMDFTTSTVSSAAAAVFNNLSERDGLPNNSIYGIVPDLKGNLWLSTNHGLARLEPHTRKVAVFSRNHGLQADEFNFGAHLRARDGRLLFGGANGYDIFDPDRLQTNPLPPPVSLTAITALGRSLYDPESYERLRRVHFTHTDDVVTFEFAALDFADPASNLFAYRLEGFDSAWNYAGSRATATYTHLPGGQYVLRVRAANGDGVWNPTGLQLAVAADPPPWKSRYTYTVYALALLAASAWLLRRRHFKIAQQAAHRRELEEQVRARTSELAQKNAALREANALLETASFTDPLTGLGNRRSLDLAVPGLIESIKLENRRDRNNARLAVLLVDLDRLKPINDQYGHEAGDRLLKEVASILRECVREGDKIVRWGGDEFVIVHRVHDLDGAAVLAERIRRTVAKRLFQVGASEAGRTSCSIGFALYPFAPAQFADLGWEKALGVADANLYRAKKTRNSWVGCAGIRAGMRPGEPESRAQKDLEAAEHENIIAVVRSGRTDGETVNLLLRHPLPRTRGH